MIRSARFSLPAALLAVVVSFPSTSLAQNGPPRFGVEDMAYDVPPLLLNAKEIKQALLESYPTELREAAISGSVVVWLYVDDSGSVAESLLHKRSDHEAFDAAALSIVRRMQFRPALMDEEPVAVWMLQRVDFNTQ